MLPRGLTSRIVLAFAGLSAAMLVAVAVTLFLVLHQLHQNEIEDTLSRQLVQVVVNLSREPVAQWDSTLQDAGGPIADDGGYILVQNPNGAIRVLAGSPSSLTIPTGPTSPRSPTRCGPARRRRRRARRDRCRRCAAAPRSARGRTTRRASCEALARG